MGVVVEEGVASSFEVDEFALVAFPFVAFGKFGDLLEGGDAVVSSVQEQTGGEVLHGKLGKWTV